MDPWKINVLSVCATRVFADFKDANYLNGVWRNRREIRLDSIVVELMIAVENDDEAGANAILVAEGLV